MNVEQIVAALIEERSKIEKAIAILEERGSWTFHTPFSTTVGPKKETAHLGREPEENGGRPEEALGGFESWEVGMDRDEAILKLISKFRKGREVDEVKLAMFLRRFPKQPSAGVERRFDEKESGPDPDEMNEMDAMTPQELEVLQDCIANFESHVSKQIMRFMS